MGEMHRQYHRASAGSDMAMMRGVMYVRSRSPAAPPWCLVSDDVTERIFCLADEYRSPCRAVESTHRCISARTTALEKKDEALLAAAPSDGVVDGALLCPALAVDGSRECVGVSCGMLQGQ